MGQWYRLELSLYLTAEQADSFGSNFYDAFREVVLATLDADPHPPVYAGDMSLKLEVDDGHD